MQYKEIMHINAERNEVTKPLSGDKELGANAFLRENCFANVVGIGIGKKMVDGTPTDTDCIRIYVQSKLDIEDLPPAALLPSDFSDVPTDIIEVGVFRRAGKPATHVNELVPGFPIRLKSDRSNVSPSVVGTLGAVVKNADGLFILSCNHILAMNGRAEGLKVVSGAFASGNNGRKRIAEIDGIAEIKGGFVPLVRDRDGNGNWNRVDFSLARIMQNSVSPSFPGDIGNLEPTPIDPKLGMRVKKHGAATQCTTGTIVDVNADFFIDYSFGTFRFTNQVVIDSGKDSVDFAIDGDSGSIVAVEVGVEDQKKRYATAMVFAEAGRFAVACP